MKSLNQIKNAKNAKKSGEPNFIIIIETIQTPPSFSFIYYKSS